MRESHGGRWEQVALAIGGLGAVLILIGFFPSITGLEASAGFGVVQILTILLGSIILCLGAFIYVQTKLWPGQKHTLWQQIGVRLSMTGLLFMAASGLADVLGYGSNQPVFGETRPVVGSYQFLGMVVSFFIAAAGILIFSVSGSRDYLDDPPAEPPEKPDRKVANGDRSDSPPRQP
jgi:amino acid transporter